MIIYTKLLYFIFDFWPYLLINSIIFSTAIASTILIYSSKIELVRKKVLISIVFGSLLFSTFFTFSEIYFRYVYDEPDALGFLKVNKKWHERHVIFNNYFSRDRDFVVDKKGDVIRIGVLGDSISFGKGISDVNLRFSNLLEKKLRESGVNAEVYNLGKSGYDTVQLPKLYQDVVKHLDFDIIVWQYFLNDIRVKEDDSTAEAIIRSGDANKLVKLVIDKSYFLDFVYWRFSSSHKKVFAELRDSDLPKYKDREIFDNHKQEIEALVTTMKGDDVKVVAIIFPYLVSLGPDYPKYIHEELVSVFNSQGVETVDLLNYLDSIDKNSLVVNKFDSHPNEYVNLLAAEKLYEAVAKLIK